MEWFLYIAGMLALGVGVGAVSAGLGLGGGIIMVPAFITFVPGMEEHTAKGTSLFIILFVALLNAIRLNRGVYPKPWRLAAVLAAGAIIGGYASAWITAQMPGWVILVFFLVFLLAVGVCTLFLQPKAVDAAMLRQRDLLAAFIGCMTGLVGGSTGTGGGTLLVPIALMAGIVTNARVVGLSNMVMVTTSIAGTIAHFQAPAIYPGPWTVGHVALSLAPLVFVGAQAGSLIGQRINARLTLYTRRMVMGVLLLAIAARVTCQLYAYW
ncbi:MAG: sulfite exporter TauE/SafE family protein [Candidatus Hydrogenedentota bacterium]